MNSLIDLRSDTVTRPSQAMRKAMAAADVGDDVFGEDPSVNQLQETVADMLGKDAALFTPSGVMANQIALKCHTRPGEEVLAERWSHILNYETGAPAMLSGVLVVPVEGVKGIIGAEQLAPMVRPDVYYMPRTALVCLENTHNMAGGTIYPVETIEKIRSFCSSRSIALHLDGARLWNASVASGTSLKEYGRNVDSVSVCFSKGLGAPVGSAIAGSKEFIDHARRYRKMFGGGMRQAGVLAAAALVAVKENVGRLKEDHEKAKKLADGLAEVKSLRIDPGTVQTNIVIADCSQTGRTVQELLELLKKEGVMLTPAGTESIRAVTHMDVTMRQIEQALSIIQRVCS